MIVINLFGGPGCGKSTGAAYIFSKLKMMGVDAELVTEFAKDKVWESNEEVFKNQAYIFGKQSFKMSRCKDKVDVIVTDSPLLLSAIYNEEEILGEDFNKVVLNVFNSYGNVNFFLIRKKVYNPNGRLQTEEEAKEVDEKIKRFLDEHDVFFRCEDGTMEGYDRIVDYVLNLRKG